MDDDRRSGDGSCRHALADLVIKVRVPRGREVRNENDDVGCGDLLFGACDAGSFERVVRVTQAGDVAELNPPAVDGGGGGKHIAGCTWLMPDDRTLIAENRVHDAAFADIGSSGEN